MSLLAYPTQNCTKKSPQVWNIIDRYCFVRRALHVLIIFYPPPDGPPTIGEFSFLVASCNNSVSTSVGFICTYRTTLPLMKQFFSDVNWGYLSWLTTFTDVNLILRYWSTLCNVPVRTTSFLSSTAISLPTRVLKKEKNNCNTKGGDYTRSKWWEKKMMHVKIKEKWKMADGCRCIRKNRTHHDFLLLIILGRLCRAMIFDLCLCDCQNDREEYPLTLNFVDKRRTLIS